MSSNIFYPRNKYGGNVELDQFEAKMHDGKVFDIHAEKLNLEYTSSYDIYFTPGTKDVVIVFDAAVTGGRTSVVIYEDPTCSAGTAITCYNRARNSSNVCEMVVVENPSVTATGSIPFVKKQIFAEAGIGQTKISSSITPGLKRIFGKNKTYLMRFTNEASGATVLIDMEGSFFEEA